MAIFGIARLLEIMARRTKSEIKNFVFEEKLFKLIIVFTDT
jgi:hypothetical protein